MQEIEIKAVLRDKEGVIEKLNSLGCELSNPIHQKDSVFVEHTGSLDIFLANPAFLRIRVNNDSETIFTVKKRTGALVALEHEVVVNSKEEMENILALLGFTQACEIQKTRYKTSYQGCEICLDEVKNLGSFIEMEKLSADGNAEEIQEELFRFFETLGISRVDRITKGYDILLLEQQYQTSDRA